MRVLVFGDSITQGYWAIEHGWVDRVRMHYDALQAENLDGRDEPSVFNLGVSADNSDNILNRIESEVSVRTRSNHLVKPIVLIQIGVNDSAKEPEHPQVDLKRYQDNLKDIASRLQSKTSKIIFVGLSSCDESKTSPVSWGEYYYSNDAIGAYENAMKTVAEKTGSDFIPVFNEFHSFLKNGDMLLSDGLHPNELGHQRIYEIIMPKLQELLK